MGNTHELIAIHQSQSNRNASCTTPGGDSRYVNKYGGDEGLVYEGLVYEDCGSPCTPRTPRIIDVEYRPERRWMQKIPDQDERMIIAALTEDLNNCHDSDEIDEIDFPKIVDSPKIVDAVDKALAAPADPHFDLARAVEEKKLPRRIFRQLEKWNQAIRRALRSGCGGDPVEREPPSPSSVAQSAEAA